MLICNYFWCSSLTNSGANLHWCFCVDKSGAHYNLYRFSFITSSGVYYSLTLVVIWFVCDAMKFRKMYELCFYIYLSLIQQDTFVVNQRVFWKKSWNLYHCTTEIVSSIFWNSQQAAEETCFRCKHITRNFTIFIRKH